MQPINQLVDKTNNKNNAATAFRLPNNYVGAQGAIIESDISKTQKIKQVDHLKTNSSSSDEIIYKDDNNTTPTNPNTDNSGYGSLIISTANGKTDYIANETVTVAVMSSSNVLKWTVEGVDITQVNIQPQQTNFNGTKVIDLTLKDPSIIKSSTPVKITSTDEQNKKRGSVTVTYTAQANSGDTSSTYRVTAKAQSYEPTQTANLEINPANTNFTVEGIDNNLLDISTYFSSTGVGDGKPGTTDVYIQPKNPEAITQDYTVTVKVNDNGKVSSASYTLKKYRDKSYDNTVDNSNTVQGHVQTYLDVSDKAHLANDEKGSGPFTVKVNDKVVGTFNNLEDIKIDGVTTYWYSNYEHTFINTTSDYKTIDIISTKSADLRYKPTNYDSVNALVNTTYDGDKTNTIYLAPNRDEYASNSDVKKAEEQRSQTNVVRLAQDTSSTTPQRATLIINDQYAYVDEDFTGDYNKLLSKANLFITPQDSSSLIAIYAGSNTTKNIDAKLIVSDKRDPTTGMTVSPSNSLYYDKVSNITSFFLPPANMA